MKKIKNKNKNKSYKLVTFLLILLAIMIVSKTYSTSTLSKINYEVEKVKEEIKEQEKTNESLSMAIDELASLTKIEEVAKETGLSYNNDNIKTIDEDEEENNLDSN